jgi:CBS domain-containing protein
MENYRYTAVPMLDRGGKYVGTLTEGDLLRRLQEDLHENISAIGQERISKEAKLKSFRPWKYSRCASGADIEDLVMRSMNQNFRPGRRRPRMCSSASYREERSSNTATDTAQ